MYVETRISNEPRLDFIVVPPPSNIMEVKKKHLP